MKLEKSEIDDKLMNDLKNLYSTSTIKQYQQNRLAWITYLVVKIIIICIVYYN